MLATLDKYGRIVIPKKVREALELEPGTELAIETTRRRIVLQPVRDEPEFVDKEGVLVVESSAVEPLDEAVRKARERRIEKVATTTAP